MADVGDELAAGFLRGFNAGDVVKHDQRAARRQRSGVDFKDAAGSKQAGAAHAELAALERATDAGQQLRIAHKVDERAAGGNLRSENALHDGVGPANEAGRGNGDDRFLHGVEHDGQLIAPALELGKVPAEPDRSFVERGLCRRELGDAAERAGCRIESVDAGVQIAIGNAASKSDDTVQASGEAPRNECGHGYGYDKGYKARHEGVAAECAQGRLARAIDEYAKDERARRRVEHEKDDEETEQSGKDFGGHKGSY